MKPGTVMNDCYYTKQSIDKYHLLNLLGQSDMSEVYMAEDTTQQQKVAIKLLYGQWEGTAAQKFLTQTEMIMSLQHTHIMPILDYGIEDGVAFIVMQFAAQGNLRQRHPRGTPVSLENILEYVKQTSRALYFIHERGLVHRDIKPHNLLIGDLGELLLSDFGASIVSHSLSPIRSTQRDFEGTAPYAAPEQLQGKPRRSSDQYALGIMVYEWITGDWPFNGSFYEITHQHLFVTPPPFQKRGISYPANIEQVIMRTLEKDPTKRYPSVKRFADELEWAYKIAQARGQLPAARIQEPQTPLPPVLELTTQEEQPETPQRRQFRSPWPF